MEEKKDNAFYNLPKKVWDILVIVFMVIAIATILCDGLLFLYPVPRTTKLGVGLTGVVSAFIVLLLLIYSYIPKVKAKWDAQKIEQMINDPRNAEIIAKIKKDKIVSNKETTSDEDFDKIEEMEE